VRWSEILALIKKYEGKDERNFVLLSDQYLNQMDVVIEKEETITALRQMKTIRYVEQIIIILKTSTIQYRSKIFWKRFFRMWVFNSDFKCCRLYSTTPSAKFHGRLPNTVFLMPGITVQERELLSD
jgi:hypothetical protein